MASIEPYFGSGRRREEKKRRREEKKRRREEKQKMRRGEKKEEQKKNMEVGRLPREDIHDEHLCRAPARRR